ncbi:MAG: acetate kinase [Planctomycetes bacterium]|nr:acetate kinase [Planctomycetota bacterium]
MSEILLLNAGSSSLKGSLVEADTGRVVAHALADWAGAATQYRYTVVGTPVHAGPADWRGHAAAVRQFLLDLTQTTPVALPDRAHLIAVGHRVVHGGPFSSSVQITPEVRERIAGLIDLAPLHNPPSLAALDAAAVELPGIPHVAVFDTAFHATLADWACTYAVPARWTRDWGIRRFGFHGLSHAYCANRAAELLGRSTADLRLVICHLGHGCSATAVKGGKSVDTTMGFTPLAGLMMGTRSGSIDPSIVLHVQKRHGLTVEQVDQALNRESGLLGVSEISGDMRQVLAAARQGHGPAKLALEIYAHRVRQEIGALTVTLGGIDALVFTAGVGENAPEVRARICNGLDCLGLSLDGGANEACRPDQDIASPESRGRILVIATQEDVTMWREVRQVIAEQTA